jgi:hypothetical protein
VCGDCHRYGDCDDCVGAGTFNQTFKNREAVELPREVGDCRLEYHGCCREDV